MNQAKKEARIRWDMGKSIPGRGSSLYKGPEVRTSRVAGTECVRGRVGGGEGREVTRQTLQGFGEDFGVYLE